MRALLLLLAFSLGFLGTGLPSPAKGASAAASLYNQGNKFYQEGDYEKARELYLQALAAGAEDPDLYYNLGNAEFRRGKLGLAIANYLRAQRLAPRDKEIKANLEYARKQVSARPAELKRGPLSKGFFWVASLLSANEWTGVLVGLYWLMGLAGTGLILSERQARRKIFFLLLLLALGTALLLLPFGAFKIKQDFFTSRAVVVEEKVPARSGPEPDLAVIIELVEGVEVVVDHCENGWCQVKIPGGFRGWVKASSLEML